MPSLDWYECGPLSEALKEAGMPEDALEWEKKDAEESGGKHDCTDCNAFYADPDAPETGYWIQTSRSYYDGIRSAHSDGIRYRRTMVEVTKMEPAYAAL